MRLTRVEIHGFKSFADRTPLDLSPGLTAIVGPNGCGKSNVIDAVKWALGEQRPTALRGAEMLDVVFKGNGARAARNFAEVSLHFDNADGVLPVDYTEVVITRRLFRSGESEYLINKAPVRLKDVRNLLMDTGLGTGAYSVMEQGRIDAILSANAVDRRRIFEEAAGISRYRARRRESESKLERTEQNLARLADVVDELEKRDRSLRIQAGRAKAFLEARDRLRELRSAFFQHQWRTLGSQLAEQEAALSGLVEAERARRAELEGARVEVSRLQEALSAARAEVDRQADAFRQASSEVEALAERERQLGERLVEIAERQEQLGQRLAGLERALAERRAEAAAIEERLGEASADVLAHEELVEERRLATAAAEESLGEARRRSAARRDEAQQRQARLTEARSSKAGADSRRAAVLAATERVKTLVADLERQLDEQRAIQGELFAGARDLDAALESARRRVDERRAERSAVGEALGSLDDELVRRREDLAAAESRGQALAELLARREGVSPGAVALLAADLSGLRGLLVEHLRSPRELAEAVEAALGATTQAVLAGSRADAVAALRHLSETAAGRVQLVPADGLRPRQGAADGVRLLDRIEVLDHREVFEALLGHVRVVADREQLSTCLPDGVTVWVTPAGDLLDERGVLHGGRSGEESGLVTRRADLDELDERCTVLRQQLQGLRARRAQHEGDLAVADEQLVEAERVARRTESERERCQERERQASARRTALERELSVQRQELSSLAQELAAVDRAHDDAARREGELAAEVEADAEREARTEHELAALSAAVRDASETHAAARLELSARVERRQALQQEQRQVQRGVEERAEALGHARSEVDDLARRRAALEHERAGLGERAAALSEERDRRAGALEQARAAAGRVGSELAEGQKRVVEAEERLGRASDELGSRRLAAQETRIRRDELRRSVQEELQLDLAAEAAPPAEEATDWPAVAAEIDDLRGKLARMGNVNLAAVDELGEVEERLRFLTGQRDDLLEARQALAETIARVNRESRERFQATFDEVREHFKAIFRKLFRGGRADIALEEGVDVLDAGIEITAAPPGKDARTITLLSGGERTLTAVGLLFALFRSRPSPVCLLDEVDAALDETNIDRFCSVLEDFLGQSQFVVVTHARRTMSYADTIFGVTMQEHGVSKVLSLSLEQYDEAKAAGGAGKQVEAKQAVPRRDLVDGEREIVAEDEGGADGANGGGRLAEAARRRSPVTERAPLQADAANPN